MNIISEAKSKSLATDLLRFDLLAKISLIIILPFRNSTLLCAHIDFLVD